MAKTTHKVYLDHLIKRDSLLYKRSTQQGEQNPAPQDYLEIKGLYGEESWAWQLRKPDFQRATWSWTAEECVDLLEAVLTEQVVPSIILWTAPDTKIYVLDGGHRISVLLAWIEDKWGQEVSPAPAKQVRDLLKSRDIGTFQEWRHALAEYKRLTIDEQAPEMSMSPADVRHARQMGRWQSTKTGFPILWVRGDYETAERSFLKINKTGRRLSEWETKLVENRTSSFARIVMSLANVDDAQHCWPKQDSENTQNSAIIEGKVKHILQRSKQLHELLFDPPYSTPLTSPKQALFAVPPTRPEEKPNYAGELLTIVEGKKGKKPQMEALIAMDKGATSTTIVNNANKLLDDAFDVLNNIYGQSSRSLTLMPIVFFYSTQGAYVRSLLYGMLYWLTHEAEPGDVLLRKLLFTQHRKAFEDVLIRDKERIIKRIARRIGSGTEVTYPTAKYFNGLLEILVQYKDDVDSKEFKAAHDALIENLGKKPTDSKEEEKVSSSRGFQGSIRETVQARNFVDLFKSCEICGGRFYPGLYTEVDHRVAHAQGGKTKASNGRETHPFCNNNRVRIEGLLAQVEVISLPTFEDPDNLPKPQQLSLLSLFEEHHEEEIDEESGDESSLTSE